MCHYPIPNPRRLMTSQLCPRSQNLRRSMTSQLCPRSHTKTRVCFLACNLSTVAHDVFFTVYPADWLMKDGLVTKRIWAHIRNSGSYPGGFERGYYEGERVLILSGEREDEIEVNVKQRTIMIPARFLCLQIPTSRGQDVVVISGENVGEQFLTRKQREDGSFPLGRRGHKGSPICTVQASRLARCDLA